MEILSRELKTSGCTAIVVAIYFCKELVSEVSTTGVFPMDSIYQKWLRSASSVVQEKIEA